MLFSPQDWGSRRKQMIFASGYWSIALIKDNILSSLKMLWKILPKVKNFHLTKVIKWYKGDLLIFQQLEAELKLLKGGRPAMSTGCRERYVNGRHRLSCHNDHNGVYCHRTHNLFFKLYLFLTNIFVHSKMSVASGERSFSTRRRIKIYTKVSCPVNDTAMYLSLVS